VRDATRVQFGDKWSSALRCVLSQSFTNLFLHDSDKGRCAKRLRHYLMLCDR
jgi:hypothetical protein